MSEVIVNENSLSDIGDAIRSVNGQSTTYLPSEMPDAIRSLDVKEIVWCHVVGQTDYAGDWLSTESGGEPITPQTEKLYVIIGGTRENEAYRWGGSSYEPIAPPTATASSDGIMSSADKSKLDGIASGATANVASSSVPIVDGTASAGSSTDYARADHVHPTDTSRASASDLSTHTSDTTVHVTAAERGTWNAKASTDTATQSANGLMSSTDKTKLDGIESGANAYTLPTMAADTKGGAKLGRGLTVDDGELSVALAAESDGSTAGPIVELTAKGWAEQDSTVDPPSPSPDYPQEIRVARGRNLIDEAAVTDGYKPSSTDGQPELSPSYSITDYIEVVGGATYTVQLLRDKATTNNIGIAAVYYDTSRAFVSYVVLQSGNKRIERSIVTFVVPSGASYMRIGYAAIGTNPQLELGSTPTPYVPYGHVGLEAYGKNLCPISQSDHTSSRTQTYDLSYGIPSGRYTVSMTINASASGSMGIKFIDGFTSAFRNVTFSVVAGTQTVKQTISIDWPTTRLYVYVDSDYWNNGVRMSVSDIQLEKGSTATPYEPHHHEAIPIPLPSRGWVGSLPDGTCDTLALDGAGGYVWTERTAEVVFDGSEADWKYQEGARAHITVNDLKTAYNANTVANGLCDHFSRKSNTQTSSSSVGFSFGTSSPYMHFCDGNQSTTLSSFKSWLVQNPVTVLYPLATPTTESGYTDMPIIPDGATLSCAELDGLRVRYCADGVAAELARQWYERARSEYEGRITALEQAVASIIAG